MSNKRKPQIKATIIKASDTATLRKAETITQVNSSEENNAGDWIEPPTDLRGFKELERHSTILPQCIRAYKNNIAGFGIGVRYIEDVDESSDMAKEFQRAVDIVETLTMEQDTKEVFEDIIEARETYGTAYLEVIRNIGGEVVQIEFVNDTVSVRKTRPLEPYIDCTYYHRGTEITRKKKFRKYRQQIGGKTVYFKEFGDTRIMDRRSGEYCEEGETLDIKYQANEIIEFPIGTAPYGEVRWVGQILGVDGSRKAENLNNNYFRNGRHTPLMIVIKGGTLTDDSFSKLRQYMDEIKGENGQHSFLLLETEATEGRTDFDSKEKPDIEIKDIANILQKDELFQDYLDNNRRKVQSAFQLPDLYVGYTTDFNRATAQTAMEVTEEQVFQPERKSLAWIINNKLLSDYQFKHVEIYFKEPNITNPDDVYKLLSVCSRAGGLTPNKAKEIVYNAYGETSEDYEGDWGNLPMGITTQQQVEPELDVDGITESLSKQIRKAASSHDDAVVAVMKEVRNLLLQKKRKCDIIEKTQENGWAEINGTPVHFDENGNVDMGPQGIKDFFSRKKGGGSNSSQSGNVSLDWRKIDGEHDLYSDTYWANPYYSQIDGRYSKNCQRTVAAYEMRRRGYDVMAKPAILKGNDPVKDDWKNIFEKAEWIDCSGNGKSDVISNMETWGDGARAIVYCQWKNGGAHVFMAERISGKTVFCDPQTRDTDVDNYFKRTVDNSVMVCRCDNLNPSEMIKDCCEELD